MIFFLFVWTHVCVYFNGVFRNYGRQTYNARMSQLIPLLKLFIHTLGTYRYYECLENKYVVGPYSIKS